MNGFDTQLARRLHDLVDDTADEAPCELLLRRGWQARRRRTLRLRTATAAVAILAAAAATAGSLGWAATGPAVNPARAPAPTAQARLAAAVTASQSVSYRIKVTEPTGNGTVRATWGAFDPGTTTGYLHSVWFGAPPNTVCRLPSITDKPGPVSPCTVNYQEMLVHGALYFSSDDGQHWARVLGSFNRLDEYDADFGGAVGASSDPRELFEALRRAGATITQTGTDTYEFHVTVNGPNTPRTTVRRDYAGTVTLDAQQRIAEVAYQITVHETRGGITGTWVRHLNVEMSGYGLPVTVQPPTGVAK